MEYVGYGVPTAQHVRDALSDANLDATQVNPVQVSRWVQALAGAKRPLQRNRKEAKLLRHLRSRYGRLAENPALARELVQALLAADGPARGSMHPGPNPRPRERAIHVGKKRTVEQVEQKAAEALADPEVQIHGVSVYVTDPSKWRARVLGTADVRELRTAFPLHKTMGRGHYTVELPNPVTVEIAQRFNRFFQWLTREGEA